MKYRCKTCNIFKSRHRIYNGHVDQKGKKWNFFQCPGCYQKEKRLLRMSQKNINKIHSTLQDITEDESFEKIERFHVNKSCPKCLGVLELSRYFACHMCAPELCTDAQDAFIYGAI